MPHKFMSSILSSLHFFVRTIRGHSDPNAFSRFDEAFHKQVSCKGRSFQRMQSVQPVYRVFVYKPRHPPGA